MLLSQRAFKLTTLILWVAGVSCGEGARSGSDPACDVVALGDGRIILLTDKPSVLISEDRGSTWKVSSRGVSMTRVARGAGNRLWGLYGWRGIHEPSTGSISYSDDRGGSWTTIELTGVGRFIPKAFAESDSEEPIILDMGGQLWQHQTNGSETISNWIPLGIKTPEGPGSSAVLLHDAIYVAGETKVWFSPDRGKTWNGKDMADGLLCRSEDGCWMVERPKDGRVGGIFRTQGGSLNLESKGKTIPFANGPLWAAVHGNQFISVGEGGGRRATGAITGPDGAAVEITGLEGAQARSVRIAPDGAVWIVSGALFKLENGPRVKKVWP